MKDQKTARILLVEDSRAHAKLVMMALSENKIPNVVKHFENGERALNFIENMKDEDKPDLILLDLKLPGMNGIEIMKRIKANSRAFDIPIIILTTSESEKDIRSANMNYANAYIVKPVDYEAFTEMMNDVAYYWLNYNKRAY